mmetsp:Transcript_2410/g.6475  ORF Transcript_2410/g.6475 Transcript_2410/m.6475 type:complete len:266 (-) Transcript_2410:377-1174(-)
MHELAVADALLLLVSLQPRGGRHEVVDEHRHAHLERDPADHHGEARHVDARDAVHVAVLLYQVQRHRPGVPARHLEHGHEGAREYAEVLLHQLAEEPSAQDGVDAEEDDEDDEGLEHGHEGGGDGHDELVERGDPGQQADHAQRPHDLGGEVGQPHGGEVHDADDDDGRVEVVPPDLEEAAVPVAREVEHQLADQDGGVHLVEVQVRQTGARQIPMLVLERLRQLRRDNGGDVVHEYGDARTKLEELGFVQKSGFVLEEGQCIFG